jgi:hypothetical protein
MSNNNEYANACKDRMQNEHKFMPLWRFNHDLRLRYDGFVFFVEGKTDEDFYKHSRIEVMNDETPFLYVKSEEHCDDDFKNMKGKEAVLYCFNRIKNDQTLCKENKRCIFIIDHDFDGLFSERYTFGKNDSKSITITPFHSFENYFVERVNVYKIFQHYSIPSKDMEVFLDTLRSFSDSVIEYYALKGTITNYNKRNNNNSTGKKFVRYKDKYKDKQIFIFDFSSYPYFRVDLLDHEVKSMNEFVHKKHIDPDLKSVLRVNRDRIKSNPPLFIRGHTVFNFLCKYLLYFHKIDIVGNNNIQQYNKIIEDLEIQMEIKTGNGKVLYRNNHVCI